MYKMKNCIFLLLLIVFASCVKDKPVVSAPASVQMSSDRKVYITNEGNFMNGNASVSLYDPKTKSVIEDIFKHQNNTTVGDVAQSLTYFNSSYYLVVNNSGKILVCNSDFKLTQTINGFNSPRYILPVTNSKAYVSDLYSNHIKVLNLNSNTITGTISCPGWTERMVLIYNKAYITNIKKSYVYVINTLNDTKTDSILVGSYAGNILIDKNDKIWVLSKGNPSNAIEPVLRRIDPLTDQIEKSFTFPLTDSPGDLCINKTKDTLYYLNNGVFRMAIHDLSLPSTALIAKGNKNFYGLGINHNDYHIYVSDALDYIQKSNIYIYNAFGNLESSFKAGINANSFHFE